MDKQIKILITGGNGYIAESIKNKFSGTFIVDSVSRNDFDLRNTNDTKKWFKDKYYDAVIHTAIKGGNRLEIEDASVLNDNLRMYTNLEDCSDHYKKFISFGSGAELNSSNSFYGYSKKLISKLMKHNNNFYNLRIYSVFDHNENIRRFIKSNILRYINEEDLIIHKDKFMDFIYMPDLLSIVEKYLKNDNLPKAIDCIYNTKYKLSDIAEKINKIDPKKKNKIKFYSSELDNPYIGNFTDIGLDFIGLENGIKEVYKNHEKNMVRSK
jgi:nucleoside-diphosphate-sugar epimerase